MLAKTLSVTNIHNLSYFTMIFSEPAALRRM